MITDHSAAAHAHIHAHTHRSQRADRDRACELSRNKHRICSARDSIQVINAHRTECPRPHVCTGGIEPAHTCAHGYTGCQRGFWSCVVGGLKEKYCVCMCACVPARLLKNSMSTHAHGGAQARAGAYTHTHAHVRHTDITHAHIDAQELTQTGIDHRQATRHAKTHEHSDADAQTRTHACPRCTRAHTHFVKNVSLF